MTRRKRRAAAVVLAAAFVASAASAYLFVWPRTDAPARTDAVVVFGGRSYAERIPAALRLMERGVAPVLVITGPPQGSGLCRDAAKFEVICVEPKPFTTRGDARATAAVAKARHWQSLTLVTSTWHVTRARMLLDRCYDGEIDAVGAKPPDSLRNWVEEVTHEWGGVAYFATFERSC